MRTRPAGHGCRKARIEEIVEYGQSYSGDAAANAWRVLMENLNELCHPERPRNPRFADLLEAIRSASVYGPYGS